jgi:class 3 adenylate cyclase
MDFDVTGGAPVPALLVGADNVTAEPSGATGGLVIENRDGRARVVVVESRHWVEDALSAHRVTTLQAFRDLFSGEVLRPGDEVAIAQIALLFTDLSGSTALYERVGDAAAYTLVREHYAFLTRLVRAHDGAVVKTIGDAVMAAFAEPADAVHAALAAQAGAGAMAAGALKIGLHAGPCIAVTLNDRLDYFGSMVNLAARLQGLAGSGEVVLSAALAADPGVGAVLAALAPGVPETASVRGVKRPVDVLRLRGPFTAGDAA